MSDIATDKYKDAVEPRAEQPDGEDVPEESGKAAEALTGMVRPFEISASVGRRGKNLEEDVLAVQAALNRRMNAKLAVDGRCGPASLEAITDFQKAIGQSRAEED